MLANQYIDIYTFIFADKPECGITQTESEGYQVLVCAANANPTEVSTDKCIISNTYECSN